MIKGIIFDADGTLLDSMWMWENLLEKFLEIKGIVTDENVLESVYAFSLIESCRYMKERYHLEETPEEIISEVLLLIKDFYDNDVLLKDGVAEFLEAADAAGIPMVIATSSDKSHIASAMKRLNVDKYFKDILTCAELKTNKREPEIYLRAAEVLGTKPSETAVFEDVLHGLTTAKNAGFKTVAVEDASSIHEKEELLAVSDLYIKDFRNLDVRVI